MATIKMRHCFNCGEELGCYADYDPLDTCGKRECRAGGTIHSGSGTGRCT